MNTFEIKYWTSGRENDNNLNISRYFIPLKFLKVLKLPFSGYNKKHVYARSDTNISYKRH